MVVCTSLLGHGLHFPAWTHTFLKDGGLHFPAWTHTFLKDGGLHFPAWTLGLGTSCWHKFEHNSSLFNLRVIEHNSKIFGHNDSANVTMVQNLMQLRIVKLKHCSHFSVVLKCADFRDCVKCLFKMEKKTLFQLMLVVNLKPWA